MTRSTALALTAALAFLLGAAGALPAHADEATIRKVLAERLPKLPPIDEVRPSPLAGLFEVRYGGSEILYADAKGELVIVGGAMIETKTRADLTERRLDQVLAIDFAKLPLKDAITIVQGKGTRRMAVFVDPNCGYCKQFERDLAGVKDVTIHTFLMPILGPDSTAKSRDIWCTTDPAKSWRRWMLEGVLPSKAPARCNADALERNVAFGRANRINGTPAVFFVDGTRRPGAIPAATIEQLLASAAAPKTR
jgi:thiol:disulfide interchange protein DsbC